MRKCSFPGCERAMFCREVCQGHYGQLRYGKQLTPLQKRTRRKGAGDGKGKECTKCNTYKLYEDFYVSKVTPDGYFYACKECQNEAVTARRKKMAEKKKLDELFTALHLDKS